ncbi:unnamed protein product, partial [Nesidiocoris tenuis]
MAAESRWPNLESCSKSCIWLQLETDRVFGLLRPTEEPGERKLLRNLGRGYGVGVVLQGMETFSSREASGTTRKPPSPAISTTWSRFE